MPGFIGYTRAAVGGGAGSPAMTEIATLTDEQMVARRDVLRAGRNPQIMGHPTTNGQ